MLNKKLLSFRILSATLALAMVLSAPVQPLIAQETTETPPAETVTVPEPVTQVQEPAPEEAQAPEVQTAAPETPAGENGDNGENGLDGSEEPAPEENAGTDGVASDVPAEVDTGDAATVSESHNEANTNTVDSPATGTTTIDAVNDATTNASTTAESDTGTNTASGQGGTGSVSTGDAYAAGNSINVVNTNIIDSSGLLLFLDLLFGDGYDFRDSISYFFGGGGSGTMNGCTLTGCDAANTDINLDNTATVVSSNIVRAMTGNNTASGDGGAMISTGNAYASGNSVNLVNSNLIDSNYLLVSMNSFGDTGSDIILPGAAFFEQLFAQQKSASGSLDVNTNNTATVVDSTSATADTGNNSATASEGSASVETGNAIASATSYNQVNSNLIGGTQIFMLFRIWGDWTGSITGLPAGMQWRETPMGIELVNADGTPASTSALSSPCCPGGSLGVNATNTASLTNDVQVYALTGENKADSDEGDAAIETGNAYASANSVNMVNTNLIGRNWIFMIFNIFGNFSGNIAFGQPDLWLGAVAETQNPTLPGSSMTFKFTVANKGDSDATNVRLSAKYLKELISFGEGIDIPDGREFSLGNIPRGETRDFVFSARAGEMEAGKSAAAPLTATLRSNETDGNPADNTELIDVVISNPAIYHSGPGRGEYSPDPKLVVHKVANLAASKAPVNVDYVIIIENEGGNAYDVVVKDALVGPRGNTIGTQTWKLGTVHAGEEVRIEYTVAFGSDVPPGIYTNTATITGTKGFDENVYATNMKQVTVKNRLEIRPRGEVLAATTTTPAPKCEPLITTSMRPRAGNDADEVKSLQSFLNTFEGESLEGTGVYDSRTIAAVKRFQAKYADLILAPWGITQPTGVVHHTTRKQVNELYCEGKEAFDLTDEQWAEINSFRTVLPADDIEEILKTRDIGSIDLGGQNIAEPAKVDRDSVPVMQIIPDLQPQAEEMPTSTIIRETQSFLMSPMQFVAKFLFSMVPFVHAAER